MKKLYLLGLLLLLFAISVNATVDCNLTYPASGNVVGNNTPFNVTYNVSGTKTGNASVSIFAYSSSTRNSSSTALLVNGTNTTALRHFNFTFGNSYVIEDAGDYSVYAIVKLNQSGGIIADSECTTSTSTNVVFDRTTPEPLSAITFSNPVEDGEAITATINRNLANACFIRFGGIGSARYTMALSGSTCTFTTSKNNPPNLDYLAYFEADDGMNSSFSSQQNIIIRAVKSDGGGLFGGTIVKPNSGSSGIGQSATPFNSKKNDKTILALVLLVLGYLYYKNKK